MSSYVDYIVEQLKQLTAIDSPSGYTQEVTDYLLEEYRRLGYEPVRTVKGGVIVDLGGKDDKNAIWTEAHVDTLGGIVAEIKGDGRLRISSIGGLNPHTIEGENCRIKTRFDGEYEGTFQLINASLHVNTKLSSTERTYDTMEVVIDEKVFSKEDVQKLGIAVGDYICYDPRTTITKSGYIKSRYLDDKLSAAILLGYAKYIKEENVQLERKVYQHLTVFEEVGHGGAGSIAEGVTEVLSIDMGCVGEGLECQEHQVSICAKDSRGPYHYDVVTELVKAAKRAEVDYAVDVYPSYASDADAALTAGYDVRHGLIGPGVYASHGYERSHMDAVTHTFRLLQSYLG